LHTTGGICPVSGMTYTNRAFRVHESPLLQVPPASRGEPRGARLLGSPCMQGEPLIRVHRLSSLCAGRARFFALTPSPSPTLWERGVGAHGSAPCCAFPLSRLAGEGDKGVRAKRRACPFTPARRKSPPPQRLCTEPMYPYRKDRGERSAHASHTRQLSSNSRLNSCAAFTLY